VGTFLGRTETKLPEPLTRELRDRLRGVVGDRWVIVDADRLLAYESDGLTAYRKTPRAVVLPKNTKEVSRLLGILSQEGVPVVPRGAGTGLSGGALADGDAVVVGTARMTEIIEFDPANRLARVQPGMINANLTKAAEPFGLYYAPDPSSQSACTLGGNVAENSGGPHCLKYGVTSRYVTALTVVTYDGNIVELGGFGRESGGYDLLGVFIGSEGCFGIATEIEVQLLPRPEGVQTLLAIFDRLGDAGTAVTEIMAEGLLPAALEIIDGPTIRAVEASVFAAGYPTDAEAALVIEFDGIEAGLARDVARAAEHCRVAGAREVRTADSAEERLALWRGRKKAFGAMGQISNDLMVQDGTVPRSKLTEVLELITEIGVRYDLTIANVFHAGDGNLHPNLLFDRSNAEELGRVDRASKEIMAVCVDAGGTITGEHGVGLDKRKYMTLVHGPEELDAMQAVKSVFDPLGRMNPGKVLPDRPDSASMTT
jgi:glycolate oxidase subunit GlcD